MTGFIIKGFVFCLVFLLVGFVFTTNIIANSNLIYENNIDIEIDFFCYDDQLDQYQSDYYGATAIVSGPPDINRWAQSFKPTLNVLTRVELWLCKSVGYGEINLSIRSDLNGLDLTSVSIQVDDIPYEYPGDWMLFDFSDIIVTQEEFYYIVLQSYDLATNCSWNFGDDHYSRGDAWHQNDNASWYKFYLFDYCDFCFKTYGLNNSSPDKPTIIGPKTGLINELLNFKFKATDPENNQVYYWVLWENDGWPNVYGPYNSGVEAIISHSWNIEGSHIINARAIDKYDGDSGLVYYQITITKTREINNVLLQKILERLAVYFPALYKLINN